MAVKMIALDSFFSDQADPRHVHSGKPYTVESEELADEHVEKGQGRRADDSGAKAEAAPANKADKPPANKAAGQGGRKPRTPAKRK